MVFSFWGCCSGRWGSALMATCTSSRSDVQQDTQCLGSRPRDQKPQACCFSRVARFGRCCFPSGIRHKHAELWATSIQDGPLWFGLARVTGDGATRHLSASTRMRRAG